MLFFAETPLIISYYTKNTPYEQEVENLRDSCKRFSIECLIEGIPDLGDWVKNCAYKPYFLKQKMEELKRPLLWVDADAVFLRPLCFEEFMFAPMAICQHAGVEDPSFAVHAGTIYINASKEGVEALNLWCYYCEEVVKKSNCIPSFLDQIGLFLLSKNNSSCIASIPGRYWKVFDRDQDGIALDEVVIEQRQASRRFDTDEKTSISITTKVHL